MVYGELVHILDYYFRQLRDYSRQVQLERQADTEGRRSSWSPKHWFGVKGNPDDILKLPLHFDDQLPTSSHHPPLNSSSHHSNHNYPDTTLSSTSAPSTSNYLTTSTYSDNRRSLYKVDVEKYWEQLLLRKLLPSPADRNMLTKSIVSSSGDSGIYEDGCGIMPYIDDDDDLTPIIMARPAIGSGYTGGRNGWHRSPRQYLTNWWSKFTILKMSKSIKVINFFIVRVQKNRKVCCVQVLMSPLECQLKFTQVKVFMSIVLLSEQFNIRLNRKILRI